MDRLLPMVKLCPQIIQPGIGFNAFLEDLNKAAVKYETWFKDEKSEKR
jgi:hypothetical protein